MTGSYEYMKLLLKKIQHGKCNWNIRGNLNVIFLFLGELGYTKNIVALCASGMVGTENINNSKTVDYMSIAYSVTEK
jgi:hypothetical protein